MPLEGGQRLLPLNRCEPSRLRGVRFVLCDLDDTLTLDGRLPSASYTALERLEGAGLRIVIVTGRPAGWCDMMARFWPVSAVVGENGAFSFRYDHAARRMHRRYQRSAEQRSKDRVLLQGIFAKVRARYPHVQLAEDQPYRVSDLAVDFKEDVPPLPEATIADIVAMFEAGGATAKISSIHVNAWIGDFSKLQMSLALLQEDFAAAADALADTVLYAGDSPNDEPMFAHFALTVGVANIQPFLARMRAHPAWITAAPGGVGFAELAGLLLRAQD
jgi:HAD superfamily hydrolase (TIGR01484 family)